MHAEPEILEIELGEVVPVDRVRVEVVLLQIPAEAPPLLVFSPKKSGDEQDNGGDDRRDDVDGNVTALDHFASGRKGYNLPVRLNRSMFSTTTPGGRESAYATASPISSGNSIFSRGQSPWTASQISVLVAAG